MTEEEFLGLTRWLTAAQTTPDITRARDELARYYGTGWYASPDTVAEFFRYLNSSERTVALLAELSSAAEAPDRQGAWLASVVAEIQAAERQSQQAPQQDRYTEPEFDTGYQLYYRYDRRAGAYEWSADPASGQWMDQAHADEHARSVAAQRPQPSAEAQPRYSAAEWDANARLYYRYDFVAGVYEWSADGSTGWVAAVQQPEPEPEPAVSAEVTADVAAKRAEALTAAIAEIREAGVDADQMSDEQIATMFDETVLELGGMETR